MTGDLAVGFIMGVVTGVILGVAGLSWVLHRGRGPL